MSDFHVSVLLQEVIDNLKVKKGKRYIDATLGGGGHAFEILRAGGKVLGIDLDDEALSYVLAKVADSKFEIGKDITLAEGNFRDIEKIAKENDLTDVDGVIFDLGLSSYQIENDQRGFSFQREGPLDMRMSKDFGASAADLINGLTKEELYELFNKLGEERFARTITNNIISTRGIKKIETTEELAKIVERSYGLRGEVSPFMKSKVNKKVFQALRIAVNDELNNIREALPAALSILGANGRIAVITFHSLEDRIVKWKFREFEANGLGKIITKHPIIPTSLEIDTNRRSTSAKLRIFEKY